jgi:hypothetical protein
MAKRAWPLTEMYPKRSPKNCLANWSPPRSKSWKPASLCQGRRVIATDEEGDPLYEDIGPTHAFLSRRTCSTWQRWKRRTPASPPFRALFHKARIPPRQRKVPHFSR